FCNAGSGVLRFMTGASPSSHESHSQNTPNQSTAAQAQDVAAEESSTGVSSSAPAESVIHVDGPKLPPDEAIPTLPGRIKTLLIGKPRDLKDQSLFKHLSLVAFLAWGCLRGRGVSSCC